MSWRRIPPVSSPIGLTSLVAATGASLGLLRPNRAELATRIADTFEASDVVLTDSGTSALVLALRATVPPDAVVAMPAYACIDIIAAAVGARVRVSLYDLDPGTLSPEVDSVRSALRRGAKALVVAPLFGYPVDLPSLAAVAREHGVPLIEDAAQAAGAALKGNRIGAFGDLSILSFGRGKGMTGGSGGALLIRSSRWADAGPMRRALRRPSRGFRDAAALSAQWILGRPAWYALPASIPALRLGEMIYKPPREPGEISAAAARTVPVSLSRNSQETRARQARARALSSAAARGRQFTPIQPIPDAAPGYLRLAVVDSTGRGVPEPRLGVLRGYPITLDEHVETRRILEESPATLAGARHLRDRLFTLPTHSHVTDRDVARLGKWLGDGPG